MVFIKCGESKVGKWLGIQRKRLKWYGKFPKEGIKNIKRIGGRDWPSTGGHEREYKGRVNKRAQALKALAAKQNDQNLHGRKVETTPISCPIHAHTNKFKNLKKKTKGNGKGVGVYKDS